MLVSVYIPTKNRLELLKRAIQSVKDQTYKNIEIIVVDDGSTDGTREYLMQEMNARALKAIFHEKSLGACVARNSAIMCAKGEFVTGLDDDDYFIRNRISLFIENKERLVDNIALCSGYFLERCGAIKSTPGKNKSIYFSDLLLRNYIGNQIFINRKHLVNYGIYDNKLEIWQDFELWLRLMRFSKLPMFSIKTETYVVNQINNNTISKNKKKCVNNSYDVIVKKLNLNQKEASHLKSHLFGYVSEEYSFFDLFKLYFNGELQAANALAKVKVVRVIKKILVKFS